MKCSHGEEDHRRRSLSPWALNGLLVCAGLLAGLALSRLFGFGAFLIIPLFFVGRFKSPSLGARRDHPHTNERERP